MPEIKGVIFDLDGTLLDTIADLAYAVNFGLESVGLTGHPVNAYHYYIGHGWKETMAAVLPPDTSQSVFNEVSEVSLTYYHENWHHQTKPYEGIRELLDHLDQSRRFKTVLTNKAHDLAVECIQKRLPDHRFDRILGRGKAFRPKPDPQGALMIAEDMGVDPEHVLFLGDSDVDMITGRAAGMFPVGALWGYRDAAELEKSGASCLANQPLDIVGIMEEV